MSICDARMRPFSNINDTEIECGLPTNHEGFHEGVLRDYAFPGSATTIRWSEDDRRTFRGGWYSCLSSGCILPDGHRGNHAT